MSGGCFDYAQFSFNDVAASIEELVKDNHGVDVHGYATNYSVATIARFQEAISLLKRASIYTHRIDWLVSGDDGEEDFHERLAEELKEML